MNFLTEDFIVSYFDEKNEITQYQIFLISKSESFPLLGNRFFRSGHVANRLW